MTVETGKARTVIKALPLILLDIVATAIAFIFAAWGTGVFDEVLGMSGFAGYVACLAVVNIAVFALGACTTFCGNTPALTKCCGFWLSRCSPP